METIGMTTETPADFAGPSDWDLLREYAAAGSERAFAALVERHLNLVYCVALRHCSDHGLAEEVASNVFSILARKAHTLKKEIVVVGWLFKTARYAAANARSFQNRRQRWEEHARQVSGPLVHNPSDGGEVGNAWEIIAGELDAALAELGQEDRNAILLRFYENKSLRVVGAELGISEEAARKRTSRALEKLRKRMAGRGAVCATATLGLALATSAAQSAPAGIGAAIMKAAVQAAADASLTPEIWRRTLLTFHRRSFRYAALLVLMALFFYAGAHFFSNHPANDPGPRGVFLRQMQAVWNGEGDEYANTLHLRGAEEEATRPLFVDSIRLRYKLRTNLVQRFGEEAFSRSGFPVFLDLLDTNRIRTATESIQGKQASLLLPWGTRLPFVRDRGQWKLDYFKLPGMTAPAQYQINARQRNRAIETLQSEIETGTCTNILEAYQLLQQKLKLLRTKQPVTKTKPQGLN
jgi:RNA polymerase sigma factor (sigma-70 family)